MDRRLRLVKQIRSRYNEDQHDLTNRELILYGKSSRSPESEEGFQDGQLPPGQVSFFRFRMALAVLLFAAVIFMDSNGAELAGITAEEVFEAISADYEEVIDSWAETLSDAPAESPAPSVPMSGEPALAL